MRSLIWRAVVAIGLGLVLGGAVWAQTPWNAPDAEKSKKSPLAASPKVVEQGKNVAQVNCVSCHGSGGKGNGAAAVALNPKPADWTSKKVQDEGDGEIFWKISPGAAPCRRGSTCRRTTAGRSSSTSARSRSSGGPRSPSLLPALGRMPSIRRIGAAGRDGRGVAERHITA